MTVQGKEKQIFTRHGWMDDGRRSITGISITYLHSVHRRATAARASMIVDWCRQETIFIWD